MSTNRQKAIEKLERARSGKLRHLKRARDERDPDAVEQFTAELRDVEWAIAEMQREEQHEAEREAAHAAYLSARRERPRSIKRLNPRRRAMMRRAS